MQHVTKLLLFKWNTLQAIKHALVLAKPFPQRVLENPALDGASRVAHTHAIIHYVSHLVLINRT